MSVREIKKPHLLTRRSKGVWQMTIATGKGDVDKDRILVIADKRDFKALERAVEKMRASFEQPTKPEWKQIDPPSRTN